MQRPPAPRRRNSSSPAAISPTALRVRVTRWRGRTQIVDTAASSSMFPIGRMGRPEELVAAVRYLRLDDARYVTGSMLVLDGGHNRPIASTTPGGTGSAVAREVLPKVRPRSLVLIRAEPSDELGEREFSTNYLPPPGAVDAFDQLLQYRAELVVRTCEHQEPGAVECSNDQGGFSPSVPPDRPGRGVQRCLRLQESSRELAPLGGVVSDFEAELDRHDDEGTAQGCEHRTFR